MTEKVRYAGTTLNVSTLAYVPDTFGWRILVPLDSMMPTLHGRVLILSA